MGFPCEVKELDPVKTHLHHFWHQSLHWLWCLCLVSLFKDYLNQMAATQITQETTTAAVQSHTKRDQDQYNMRLDMCMSAMPHTSWMWMVAVKGQGTHIDAQNLAKIWGITPQAACWWTIDATMLKGLPLDNTAPNPFKTLQNKWPASNFVIKTCLTPSSPTPWSQQ